MAGSLDVLVKFVADSSSVKNEVAKVEGTGSKLKGWAKGVGGAIAGGFAVGAVVNFGQAAVGAAMESEQATARLQQIFESMGDATGEAAKEAENYASVLSKKIGVDDDVIKAGQAQLATFGEVSSEVARTAGIFDRATAAGADLAAAGFGTIDSNAVQLGKALQDPTKGLTALGKAGVTFTAEQKAMIEGLQKSGDLLGAQEIVLKAVETQVKGTAEATATGSQKMNVAFGETQEAVGTALLPAVEALLPVLMTAAEFFEKHSSILIPLIAAFLALAAAVWVVNTALAANPFVLVAAAMIALVAAAYLVWQNWDKIWTWVMDHKAFAVLLLVFAPIIAQFVLTVGALKYLWNNWDTIWGWITDKVDTAIDAIMVVVGPIGEAIGAVFGRVKSAVELNVNLIRGYIDLWVTAFGLVKTAATDVYEWVKGKVEAIAGIIEGAVSGIKTAVGRVVGAIKAPINAVINAWNGMEFKIPEVEFFGKKFGGQKFDLPQLPTLARGGIVARTGLAVVHEGEQFSGVGRTFGGNTYNLNVTAPAGTDPARIGRTVVDYIRAFERANGTDWRRTG